MPCTNNTPSLAASFPRRVGRCPLTLVALHNLQRPRPVWSGCPSELQKIPHRFLWGNGPDCAGAMVNSLRLCCSNSTGTTPEEDLVVHFSLSWWRQRNMQELIYKFLTARSRASTLKNWTCSDMFWCISVMRCAHWSISQSLRVPYQIAKEKLGDRFRSFLIWWRFNTCHHISWHDQMFACCFGRSPCTMHEIRILEVETAAKPWCNDKVATNTPNTSRGNRRYRGKITVFVALWLSFTYG